MTLELIRGNLLDISRQIDLSTALCAKEHIDKRIEFRKKGRNYDPILFYEEMEIINPQRTWSWIKDYVLYTVVNGSPYIHINTKKNIIFENIYEAYPQLTKHFNYNPSEQTIDKFIKDNDTFTYNLLKLHLKEEYDDLVSFSVDDIENGNLKELKNRFYNEEHAKFLKENDKKFYIYHPEYIMREMKTNLGISFPSFISCNTNNCYFSTNLEKGITVTEGQIIGVRK